MSKDDEFCIKNEEICIKNEEFCIQNDEFCSTARGDGMERYYMVLYEDRAFEQALLNPALRMLIGYLLCARLRISIGNGRFSLVLFSNVPETFVFLRHRLLIAEAMKLC